MRMTGAIGGGFVWTRGPRQPAPPNPDPASRSANHRLDPIKVATIRCRSIPRVVASVATSLAPVMHPPRGQRPGPPRRAPAPPPCPGARQVRLRHHLAVPLDGHHPFEEENDLSAPVCPGGTPVLGENRAGCPLTPDACDRWRSAFSRVLGAAPWA